MDVVVGQDPRVEIQVEPKVVDCQLDLKEFELIRVGKLIEGKDARELGNELKDILKELIRLYDQNLAAFFRGDPAWSTEIAWSLGYIGPPAQEVREGPDVRWRWDEGVWHGGGRSLRGIDIASDSRRSRDPILLHST